MTGLKPSRSWGDWYDHGAVKSGVNHVRHVVHADGRLGIIKTPRNGNVATLKRFVDEAHLGWDLRFDHGVVTLLEIDSSAQPSWFVMEEIDLLARHLGPTPNLRDVVTSCLEVSETLARLAKANTFHRDIKPDNLFSRFGRAVVGDWGIGAFPNRSHVTRIGRGVGAAHFLAPEMRNISPQVKFGPADVYSLAKTLFALAMRDRGPYPPPGRHHLGVEEFSLYLAGQRDGHEIEGLLDAATNEQPAFRPSMLEFHDELEDWLRLTPPGHANRPPISALRRGIGPEHEMMSALVNRRVKNVSKQIWSVGRQVATALSTANDELGWHTGRVDLRGNYGFDSDLDFEPDAFIIWSSKYQPTGRRAVLGFELNDLVVTFYAECQLRPIAKSSSILWSCNPPVDAFVELPSARARLGEIVEHLIIAMK